MHMTYDTTKETKQKYINRITNKQKNKTYKTPPAFFFCRPALFYGFIRRFREITPELQNYAGMRFTGDMSSRTSSNSNCADILKLRGNLQKVPESGGNHRRNGFPTDMYILYILVTV